MIFYLSFNYSVYISLLFFHCWSFNWLIDWLDQVLEMFFWSDLAVSSVPGGECQLADIERNDVASQPLRLTGGHATRNTARHAGHSVERSRRGWLQQFYDIAARDDEPGGWTAHEYELCAAWWLVWCCSSGVIGLILNLSLTIINHLM